MLSTISVRTISNAESAESKHSLIESTFNFTSELISPSLLSTVEFTSPKRELMCSILSARAEFTAPSCSLNTLSIFSVFSLMPVTFVESTVLIFSRESFIVRFISNIAAFMSVVSTTIFSFAFCSCSSKSPVIFSTFVVKVSVAVFKVSFTEVNCVFIADVTSSSFSPIASEFVFNSSDRVFIPFWIDVFTFSDTAFKFAV